MVGPPSAASETLDPTPANIQSLSRDEFTAWLGCHPDNDYRQHMAYTPSFEEEIPDSIILRAEQHQLGPGDSYWLHQENTEWGRRFPEGCGHLWKWNGAEPLLLEAKNR